MSMENTEPENESLLADHLKQFFSSPTANFGRLEGIHLKQSPGVIAYLGFGHVELGVCSIKHVPAISFRHMDEACVDALAVLTQLPRHGSKLYE